MQDNWKGYTNNDNVKGHARIGHEGPEEVRSIALPFL